MIEKISVITDSSCDLPQKYINEHNIHVLPLHIHMPDGEYLDRVNITPQQVYENMPQIIPTTSQPSMEDINQLLSQLYAEGVRKAVVITISGAMSGTYNVFKMVIKNFHDFEIRVIDSKRLSMALGLLVIKAVEMIENNAALDEIERKIIRSIADTNGFFYVPTLEYLIKGGRIGLVTGTVGTILGIKPVVSINSDGKYYTFARVRNLELAIKKMSETLSSLTKGKKFDLAVLYGAAQERAARLYDELKSLPGIRNVYFEHISPALIVHSGPGLIGISYSII